MCWNNNPKRIAVIATGGLSHWPGEAKHGKINVAFDKKFLETLVGGDRANLTEYTHEEINAEAGSGGHEIRTWIALAGAVQGWRAELLAYEPVVPWATGCGLVAFRADRPEVNSTAETPSTLRKNFTGNNSDYLLPCILC